MAYNSDKVEDISIKVETHTWTIVEIPLGVAMSLTQIGRNHSISGTKLAAWKTNEMRKLLTENVVKCPDRKNSTAFYTQSYNNNQLFLFSFAISEID